MIRVINFDAAFPGHPHGPFYEVATVIEGHGKGITLCEGPPAARRLWAIRDQEGSKEVGNDGLPLGRRPPLCTPL